MTDEPRPSADDPLALARWIRGHARPERWTANDLAKTAEAEARRVARGQGSETMRDVYAESAARAAARADAYDAAADIIEFGFALPASIDDEAEQP